MRRDDAKGDRPADEGSQTIHAPVDKEPAKTPGTAEGDRPPGEQAGEQGPGKTAGTAEGERDV